MSKYENIMRRAASSPWAVDKKKMLEIVALLELKADGGEVSKEALEQFKAVSRATSHPVSGSVAIIPILGVISPRMNMLSDISGGTSIEALSKQLRMIMQNDSVKTIVLNVHSPGGNVMGIQEFAAELFAARKHKRIIAVANFTMASAAYWIASQAHEIVAAPSAFVGSIGVLAMHEDRSGQNEMLGIKHTIISAGKFKAEGSEDFPLSDAAHEHLQAQVEEIFTEFTKAVAKGRKVAVSVVRGGFGQGHGISSRQALKEGMIDRIDTFVNVMSELGVDIDDISGRGQQRSLLVQAPDDQTTLEGLTTGFTVDAEEPADNFPAHMAEAERVTFTSVLGDDGVERVYLKGAWPNKLPVSTEVIKGPYCDFCYDCGTDEHHIDFELANARATYRQVARKGSMIVGELITGYYTPRDTDENPAPENDGAKDTDSMKRRLATLRH